MGDLSKFVLIFSFTQGTFIHSQKQKIILRKTGKYLSVSRTLLQLNTKISKEAQAYFKGQQKSVKDYKLNMHGL